MGCFALWRLALTGRGAVVVAEAGGAASVCVALRTQLKSVAVRLSGLRALCSMCASFPHCTAVFVANGVVSLVVAATKAHSESDDIQGNGLQAISNMCSGNDVDNAVAFAASGTVPLIIATMRAHTTSTDV